MIPMLNSCILEIHPHMIFKIFHENSHYRNGHLQENRENHLNHL